VPISILRRILVLKLLYVMWILLINERMISIKIGLMPFIKVWICFRMKIIIVSSLGCNFLLTSLWQRISLFVVLVLRNWLWFLDDLIGLFSFFLCLRRRYSISTKWFFLVLKIIVISKRRIWRRVIYSMNFWISIRVLSIFNFRIFELFLWEKVWCPLRCHFWWFLFFRFLFFTRFFI